MPSFVFSFNRMHLAHLIRAYRSAKSAAWILGSRLAVLFALVFINLRSPGDIH